MKANERVGCRMEFRLREYIHRASEVFLAMRRQNEVLVHEARGVVWYGRQRWKHVENSLLF